jgi:hypothetical protein
MIIMHIDKHFYEPVLPRFDLQLAMLLNRQKTIGCGCDHPKIGYPE